MGARERFQEERAFLNIVSFRMKERETGNSSPSPKASAHIMNASRRSKRREGTAVAADSSCRLQNRRVVRRQRRMLTQRKKYTSYQTLTRILMLILVHHTFWHQFEWLSRRRPDFEPVLDHLKGEEGVKRNDFKISLKEETIETLAKEQRRGQSWSQKGNTKAGGK